MADIVGVCLSSFRCLSLVAVLSTVFASLAGYIVYTLYLHPLAKYPGPLLGRLTQAYDLYHAYIGDKHLHFYHLHQRYGSIVRFSPNSLSIGTVTTGAAGSSAAVSIVVGSIAVGLSAVGPSAVGLSAVESDAAGPNTVGLDAAGMRSLRYGTTADHVRKLKVVFANAEADEVSDDSPTFGGPGWC